MVHRRVHWGGQLCRTLCFASVQSLQQTAVIQLVHADYDRHTKGFAATSATAAAAVCLCDEKHEVWLQVQRSHGQLNDGTWLTHLLCCSRMTVFSSILYGLQRFFGVTKAVLMSTTCAPVLAAALATFTTPCRNGTFQYCCVTKLIQ